MDKTIQKRATKLFENGVRLFEQEQYVLERELFDAWLPILRKLGKPGDVTGQDLVDKLGPLGVLVLGKLMLTAKSEQVRANCAKDIAWMAGLKPVERSQTINVNVMAEAEIDALLRSKLEDFGLFNPLGGTEEGAVETSSGSGEAEEEPKDQ